MSTVNNILPPETWYLIYTKSRQEKIADENLRRQGYCTYLPFIQWHRRRRQAYQLITEPMFPRYLFIQLSSVTDNWSPIRSTRGVSCLVRFGEVPAKVPLDFIKYLQEKNNHTPMGTAPTFRKGDTVRILDGVLTGYEGIFEMKSGAKRVTLLLDMIGKTMRVEVPIDSIVAT